jgi:ferredoxin-NADP reductase
VAGAAVLERLTWRVATIADVRAETAHARTLALDVPDWPGHQAGQHVDIRLTADDGYQAQRSYSIASAPDTPRLELTVERIDDGEVSPYLTDEARPGDEFELRGPVGGWFTWDATLADPLLLVAGGSGLVPLMAMLRHRRARRSAVDTRLLLSARTLDDVLFRDEVERLGEDGVAAHLTLTRAAPPGWAGWARRVDAEMLAAVGPDPERAPRVFVCGPTPFVEAAAGLLVAVGHAAGRIRTERFGPTGG